MREFATAADRASFSIPTHWRPSFLATTAVVPLPRNGSKTTPPPRGKEPNYATCEFLWKLRLMAAVPAHRWDVPNTTGPPIGPFVGGQATPVIYGDSGSPEHVEMLEFVYRSVGDGMPPAVCPARVFVPDARVVKIKPGLLRPIRYEAPGQSDFRGDLGLAPPDVIVLDAPLHGLFGAPEHPGQFMAGYSGIPRLRVADLLRSDRRPLPVQIVSLNSGHCRVRETENIPDIDRKKASRLDDPGMSRDHRPQQITPPIKRHPLFVGLAHVVRGRPK